MANQAYRVTPKRRHGYERTRRIAVRLSEHDYKRLVERSVRAGAKTPSAYIRAACRNIKSRRTRRPGGCNLNTPEHGKLP